MTFHDTCLGMSPETVKALISDNRMISCLTCEKGAKKMLAKMSEIERKVNACEKAIEDLQSKERGSDDDVLSEMEARRRKEPNIIILELGKAKMTRKRP